MFACNAIESVSDAINNRFRAVSSPFDNEGKSIFVQWKSSKVEENIGGEITAKNRATA